MHCELFPLLSIAVEKRRGGRATWGNMAREGICAQLGIESGSPTLYLTQQCGSSKYMIVAEFPPKM